MACSLSQSSNPPPRRRNLLSFFGIFFAEMSRVVGAFVGMLEQKLQVLEAVGATTAYTSVCPLVGASVGQHVSRVARKVCCFFVKLPRCTRCGIPWTTARGRRRRWRRSRRAPRDVGAVWRCEVTATRAALLAYDVRRRGGGAETDAAAAAVRASTAVPDVPVGRRGPRAGRGRRSPVEGPVSPPRRRRRPIRHLRGAGQLPRRPEHHPARAVLRLAPRVSSSREGGARETSFFVCLSVSGTTTSP
mmetsp:Transcript_3146/g.10409  ORF Transcript_3146/g.10409 Transcript_3146/m.10409 type:complete len:246 (-) Transcript_3146:473-1210(-)